MQRKQLLKTILNEFNKKQGKVDQYVDKHYINVQENEKRNIERKISEAEKLIESTQKEVEHLRDEIKKYKYKKDEKKEDLDKKLALINESKNQIKEFSKNLNKLPANIKGRVNELKNKIKEFYKLTLGFSKIIAGKIDLDKLVKTSDDHLNFIMLINKEMPLMELIRGAGLEFKVKYPNKEIKISGFNQYMAVFLEIILYYILEENENEKIYVNKEKLSELALSYSKGMLKYSKLTQEVDSDYYNDLGKLCESEFVSLVAHREFDKFNLNTATSYFLNARDSLKSIKNLDKEFKSIVAEKIKTMEAWASDAFNIVYLLNSYRNWAEVADSENEFIKELAQITKDKVEDFVTGQYGFPDDKKINEIIKNVKFPTPTKPPIVDQIGPRH